MKQFLMEMHIHTSETSNCGKVDAATAVRLYKECGYSGMVITDHYSSGTFRKISKELPLDERIDRYLSGYRTAKAAAGDDFVVLLGMELSLNENDNDYLVYGIDEDFLRSYNCEDVLDMSLAEFSKIANERGFLLYQAHPFRKYMTIVPTNYIYGMEVYNGSPFAESNNEIANLWAEKEGLRKISGSDFHQQGHLARGGIYFSKEIRTNQELVEALKGEYSLRVTV